MTGGTGTAGLRVHLRGRPARTFPALSGHEPEGGVRSLAWNECPFPPSPRVVEAVAAAAVSLNRYPDPLARDVVAILAARAGVPAGRIVAANGSDELLYQLPQIALEPGQAAVLPAPSFPAYRMAVEFAAGRAVTAPLAADHACDAGALIAAIGADVRLVFCATVNNPSGGLMAGEGIARLAREVPEDVLLVVDDAYHEFALAAGAADPVPALGDRAGPWVVLRTLSKAYALAGARLGYALCGSEAVADGLRQAKPMFNVNALAQAAALAALEDTAHSDRIVAACGRERDRLAEGCARLGLATMPSAGNFLSVRLTRPAAEAAAQLAAAGILVKPWTEAGHEDWLRISIGRADDTDAVLAALGTLIQ